MNILILGGLASASIALLVGSFYLYFRLAPRKENEETMTGRVANAAEPAQVVGALAVGKRVIPGEGRLIEGLNREIWKAGLQSQPGRLRAALAAAVIVVMGVAVTVSSSAALLSAVGFAAAGYLFIHQMQARFRRTVTHQLPDFLEQVIRALAAGNTLDTAIASAVEESEDPVSGLFASVVRQLKLGAPLDEVVSEIADLHQIKDLHIIAMSAKVNRKYGGSLRRLLKVLITSIHQRERSEAELKALTGETRVSAFVLVLIPMAIIGFVLFKNPSYYNSAWADSFGRAMLVGTGILQVIGAIIIFRMMRSTGGDSV